MQIVQTTRERRRRKKERRRARLWKDTFRDAQAQAMALRSKEMEKFGALDPRHNEFLMQVDHYPFFARYAHVNQDGLTCGCLHIYEIATCPGNVEDSKMMLLIPRDDEMIEKAKTQYAQMVDQIETLMERLRVERRQKRLG